jgi:hypothetical protein
LHFAFTMPNQREGAASASHLLPPVAGLICVSLLILEPFQQPPHGRRRNEAPVLPRAPVAAGHAAFGESALQRRERRRRQQGVGGGKRGCLQLVYGYCHGIQCGGIPSAGKVRLKAVQIDDALQGDLEASLCGGGHTGWRRYTVVLLHARGAGGIMMLLVGRARCPCRPSADRTMRHRAAWLCTTERVGGEARGALLYAMKPHVVSFDLPPKGSDTIRSRLEITLLLAPES